MKRAENLTSQRRGFSAIHPATLCAPQPTVSRCTLLIEPAVYEAGLGFKNCLFKPSGVLKLIKTVVYLIEIITGYIPLVTTPYWGDIPSFDIAYYKYIVALTFS
jgi:hypothetical protein